MHATVRAHLQTFVAQMEQRGDAAGLPGFVISEFESYLNCGILAHGFARVCCTSCGDETLVAFFGMEPTIRVGAFGFRCDASFHHPREVWCTLY